MALEACPPRMQSSLKIVIVDENPIRAAILEDGLREAGHVHVVRVDETSHLLARIYTIDPDVILIDLENPSRDVLEQMFQVSRAVKRPVAMFVDQSDTASIRGRGRCRRVRLHRRRAAEGAHQEHPRSLHLALQFLCSPA
jgi:response regulator NasT